MNSKEKTAINMLNRGMSEDEIVRKMRVSKTWLRLMKEKTV